MGGRLWTVFSGLPHCWLQSMFYQGWGLVGERRAGGREGALLFLNSSAEFLPAVEGTPDSGYRMDSYRLAVVSAPFKAAMLMTVSLAVWYQASHCGPAKHDSSLYSLGTNPPSFCSSRIFLLLLIFWPFMHFCAYLPALYSLHSLFEIRLGT